MVILGWFGLVWFGLGWVDLVWFGLVCFALLCFAMEDICGMMDALERAPHAPPPNFKTGRREHRDI